MILAITITLTIIGLLWVILSFLGFVFVCMDGGGLDAMVLVLVGLCGFWPLYAAYWLAVTQLGWSFV